MEQVNKFDLWYINPEASTPPAVLAAEKQVYVNNNM